MLERGLQENQRRRGWGRIAEAEAAIFFEAGIKKASGLLFLCCYQFTAAELCLQYKRICPIGALFKR